MRNSLKTMCCAALVTSFIAAGAARARAQDDPATAETTASLPGILPAFITAGPPDPAGIVPAYNSVPGSWVDNIDIAVPFTLLDHGKRYVYLVAFQSLTYTGDYTVRYKLKQVIDGKTEVLDSGTIVSDKSARPHGVYAPSALSAPVPDSPGLATLEAEIIYGKETATTSTQVLIQ
jgi:hypothetical protein